MTRRGSDRLAHLDKRAVSEAQLKRLAALADADGVELLDWRWKGTPDIDFGSATFGSRPQSAGRLVDQLLRQGVVRHIDVFPFGLPAIDRVQIQVATERQR